MSYGRSGYRRRGYAPTVGRVAKPNQRPGACRDCGEEVPAFGGQLWRESGGTWSVVHVEATRGGWLMDPQPIKGGCPVDTDKTNAESHAAGFFGKDAPLPRSERDRIAVVAAAAVARETARGGYRLNSGAVVQGSRGRCEDAPCCGCCD